MVPPGLLHDTRICTEDLEFDESDNDELREEGEMQDECRRWNAQTEATWVKEASKLLKSTRSSSLSDTNASDTSETSPTSNVETPTPESLQRGLSSYNSGEGTSFHWCLARPESLMARLKTEGPMACDRLK